MKGRFYFFASPPSVEVQSAENVSVTITDDLPASVPLYREKRTAIDSARSAARWFDPPNIWIVQVNSDLEAFETWRSAHGAAEPSLGVLKAFVEVTGAKMIKAGEVTSG